MLFGKTCELEFPSIVANIEASGEASWSQSRSFTRTFSTWVLAFVPDLVVAWAVMRLTDNEWFSFWMTLVALQAIYFFLWAKRALWSWLLFWIVGRRQIARNLENVFIDSRFPPPNEYTLDLEDYYSRMAANEELACDMRTRVAYWNGTLNGMKASGRYSMVFQINSASKIALKRYAKLAAKFSPTSP